MQTILTYWILDPIQWIQGGNPAFFDKAKIASYGNGLGGKFFLSVTLQTLQKVAVAITWPREPLTFRSGSRRGANSILQRSSRFSQPF